jgi:hypothetical protein
MTSNPAARNPQVQQTNELVNLFSKTLQSLAADAVAVRQATSLSRCLGVVSKEDGKTTTDSTNTGTAQFHEGLWDLDELVSGLEEKVTALRQIVSEEKRSIAKFESTLQQEAEEQAALVSQIVQALEEHEQQQQQQLAPPHRHQTTIPEFEDEEDENGSTASETSSKRASGGSSSSRRDSVDPRSHSELENQDPVISLPRITRQELEDYKSKNVMGPRMLSSLLDLNEALEEIELLCQRQRHAALVLKRKQQQQLQHAGSVSSGALQRRYDYLQRRQQAHNSTSSTSTTPTTCNNSSLEESGDDTIISITEQDLREKCAFFRHGERTARTTLSVLCSLKRLKQVPNKNRQVTYHLLV